MYCFFFVCIKLMKSRPVNKKELFNLRHASARKAIRQCFGVLKNRFRILLHASGLSYPIEIQAHIPAALCTVHNFIRIHESDEEPIHDDNFGGYTRSDSESDLDGDDEELTLPDDHLDGDLWAESDESDDDPKAGEGEDTDLRDKIADEMWKDYVNTHQDMDSDMDNDDSTV